MWDAAVASNSQGPFGQTAMTHNAGVALEVTPVGAPPSPTTTSAVGQVYLGVQPTGGPLAYLAVALDYTPGADNCSQVDGGPLDQMTCTVE